MLIIPIFISFTNIRIEDFDIKKKVHAGSHNQQSTMELYGLLLKNIVRVVL